MMSAATIAAGEFEAPEGPDVAEVVAIYARTVFDVRHCAHGSYTVGDAQQVSFPMISSVLPDPHSFPLVRWQAGSIALRFTADMRGELVEGARRSSLHELIASGRALPIDGAFTIELAPGARGVIALDDITFELRSVPAARRPARFTGFDLGWWPHVLGTLIVLGILMLFAEMSLAPIDTIERDEAPITSGSRSETADPYAPRTTRTRHAAPPRPTGDGASTPPGDSGLLGDPRTTTHHLLAIATRRPLGAAGRFDPAIGPVLDRPFGRSSLPTGHFLATHDSDLDLAGGRDPDDQWGRDGDVSGAGHGVGGLGDRDTGRGAAGSWVYDGFAGARRLERTNREWRELGLVGPLALVDVRRIVDWRRGALRRCGPLGDAQVHFTINGAGLVTGVAVAAVGPRETRSARCVAREIRRMWFPRGVGSVRVTYPLPL